MYTIDTSVWVNAVEAHEPDHTTSRQLLRQIRNRQISVVVPSLVAVEVAGTISRLRDPTSGRRRAAILLRLRRVTFVPLDDTLTRRAVALAAAHRLRGADAVYAAVAQQFSTTLVSRDKEHLTRLAGIVPVLHPAAALAALPGP